MQVRRGDQVLLNRGYDMADTRHRCRQRPGHPVPDRLAHQAVHRARRAETAGTHPATGLSVTILSNLATAKVNDISQMLFRLAG